MRPRYLEIEGLQSFKEVQEIDFDRLGETGLFGIFGPTGSGKSTILDAITLALYGNVQRADRGTKGIINMALDNVRVSFVFDLVKSKIRKTYKVERIYRRRKDSENSIESRVARLIELGSPLEVVIADKHTEVNSAVIELIGLEFDDFTRSVVLPQNKFQEFLLSSKSEKTKMLERIFYLEEYGRELTDKVNRNLGRVRNKLSGTMGALSVLGDISETSLKDSKSSFDAAAERKKRIDNALKASEIEYNEANEVWKLSAELREATDRQEELSGAADEMESIRICCKNALEAQSLSLSINDIKKTDTELKKTAEELGKLEKELSKSAAELKKGEEELIKASTLRQERIPILVEHKTKLEKALQTEREIEKIEEVLEKLRNEHKVLKGKVDSLDEFLTKHKAGLKDNLKKEEELKADAITLKVEASYRDKVHKGAALEEDLENSQNIKERQKNKYEEFAETIRRQEQELEELKSSGFALYNGVKQAQDLYERHKKEKQWDRDDLLKAETEYYRIKSVIDSLKLKNKDIDQLMLKISDFDKQAEELKQKLDGVCTKKENKLKELERARLIFEEKKKDEERNSAFLLSQNLKNNEPCPVCGSTVHPNPAAPSDSIDAASGKEAINELQIFIEKLDSEFRALENEEIKLAFQNNSIKGQIEALASDADNKQEEEKELLGRLPEDYRKLTLSLIEDNLDKMTEEKQERHKAVEAWEERLAELEKNLKKAEEEYNLYQVEISGKRSQFEANKKHLEDLKKTYIEAEEAHSSKKASYDSFIKDMEISSMRDELQRIQSNDIESESLYKKVQALENSIGELRRKIEEAEEAKKIDMEKLSENVAEGRGFRYRKEEKEKEIKLLLGDKGIKAEIAKTEEEMVALTEGEKKAQEYLGIIRERHEKAIKDKKVHEKQKEIYEEKLRNDNLRLDKELKSKGFASVEAVEEAFIPEDKLSKLQRAVKEYEDAVNSIKTQKKLIEKKLAGRSITEELWRKISLEYEELKIEKEKSIGDYESAKNKYETIISNYESWLSLTEELKEQSQKKAHLETVKNLLKGNGFIEYISEERLRYIAKEASETLGTLTGQRYGLELDTENGFVIRDDANGGMRRMVTTLSGGETFLTSLALALALSSQIQLKGQSPLEFFFLDEGFGTLDNNLLDTVIDALERLSTKERVIGLISHVPEMKNRITRRLVVEGPVVDGTGSRVYLEKA